MKLSYVITTRNHRGSLLRTLEHLRRHAYLPEHDFEILVVDNGSTDDTATAAGRLDGVRVISLAENEGVPARNLALQSARGKYVAFIGDDVRPVDRAMPQALSYLARHTKTAAVVGRVLLSGGTADAPALPAVLMGTASILRKSVLDEVGGFATEFFRQAADYELSFRIWRAGFRIERFEDLPFTRDACRAEKPSQLACRMDLRNNLILCERYLPRPFRHEYRRDWIRRYARIAQHDGHAAAARTGLKESRIWAHREDAVGRRPLGGPAIESIFQLQTQQDRVGAWAHSNGIRRVCIADWGKNMFATWRACRRAGLDVAAVLDNAPAFADTDYRGVPVIKDADASSIQFDGVLISTLNPAQVDDRMTELKSRFTVPVLRLWEPASIASPPPNKLLPQGGRIDKAA